MVLPFIVQFKAITGKNFPILYKALKYMELTYPQTCPIEAPGKNFPILYNSIILLTLTYPGTRPLCPNREKLPDFWKSKYHPICSNLLKNANCVLAHVLQYIRAWIK
jgi:hypothetical protein